MAKPLITLDAECRRLCNRLATERFRAAIWREGRDLRNQALERRRSGADPAEVRAWLSELLSAALADQGSGSN